MTYKKYSHGESPASASAALELCPRVEAGFKLLGKRWSGLIITLLLQRDARFTELARAIPGISERVLAERLRELEAEDVVSRTVEPGPPVRVTYGLTEAGRALAPAIDALRDWSDARNRAADG